MSKTYSAIRGMEDLVDPQQIALWQWIENLARQSFNRAGFTEIRTPILEEAALFERSVGEGTDIVEKEMYTLLDRNEKRLALRPEGTASVVRAFVEHFTRHNILSGRFYYLGPMFRYERPQKGRYRQFHQIGAEVFGNDHPLSDAEIMAWVNDFLKTLKLENIELQINSLGSAECRKKYLSALTGFLSKFEDQFDEEIKQRIQKNPLRVLDSKDDKVLAILQQAPKLIDFLSDESRAHFEKVQQALTQLGVDFKINDRMVRGLDYYEKTVFEFVTSDLGAQNAVAAGGRYNHLVQEIGGPAVAAVGFALGMERLVSLIDLEKISLPQPTRVYLLGLDEISTEQLFSQLKLLRQSGILTQLDFGSGSLKAKMRRASKWHADWVLILGESEREKGRVILRSMKDSSQKEIPWDQLLTQKF